MRPRNCPFAGGVISACPALVGVPHPTNVSLSAATAPQVMLPIRGLPASGTVVLECAFGAFRSHAQQHALGVRCPLAEQMPRIASGHDHARVPLTLRALGTRADLIDPAPMITFYSCAAHQL